MAEAEMDPGLTALTGSWLEAMGAHSLAAVVRVYWNGGMRTTAGTAHPRTGAIHLNPRLHALGQAEVDRTLRHEAAHLLAHWRAGRRRIQTHGPEWRQACADLGIAGEKATHTLPLGPRRRQQAKYLYQCPGCRLEVRRVRLFKRSTACLTCCRLHNHGQFDPRFQFRRVAPPGPPTGPP